MAKTRKKFFLVVVLWATLLTSTASPFVRVPSSCLPLAIELACSEHYPHALEKCIMNSKPTSYFVDTDANKICYTGRTDYCIENFCAEPQDLTKETRSSTTQALGATTQAPDIAVSSTQAPEIPASLTQAPEIAVSSTQAPGIPASLTQAPEIAVSSTQAPGMATSTTQAPDLTVSFTQAPGMAITTTRTPEPTVGFTQAPGMAITTTRTPEPTVGFTQAPGTAITMTQAPEPTHSLTQAPGMAITTTQAPEPTDSLTQAPGTAGTNTTQAAGTTNSRTRIVQLSAAATSKHLPLLHNMTQGPQDLSKLLTPLGYTLFWTQFAIGLFLFICLAIVFGLFMNFKGQVGTPDLLPQVEASTSPDINSVQVAQEVPPPPPPPSDLNACWEDSVSVKSIKHVTQEEQPPLLSDLNACWEDSVSVKSIEQRVPQEMLEPIYQDPLGAISRENYSELIELDEMGPVLTRPLAPPPPPPIKLTIEEDEGPSLKSFNREKELQDKIKFCDGSHQEKLAQKARARAFKSLDLDEQAFEDRARKTRAYDQDRARKTKAYDQDRTCKTKAYDQDRASNTKAYDQDRAYKARALGIRDPEVRFFSNSSSQERAREDRAAEDRHSHKRLEPYYANDPGCKTRGCQQQRRKKSRPVGYGKSLGKSNKYYESSDDERDQAYHNRSSRAPQNSASLGAKPKKHPSKPRYSSTDDQATKKPPPLWSSSESSESF